MRLALKLGRLVAVVSVLLLLTLTGLAGATGDFPVILGEVNLEYTPTEITNNSVRDERTGLIVRSNTGNALEVWGSSVGVVVTGNQTGVLAQAGLPGAVALEVDGRAVFSRSGSATVPVGSGSVTVSGVALTEDSLVLATLQQRQNRVWVQAAVPDVGAHSFTIFLNRPAPGDTVVAWFILS
jgi:hypothetical protein